MRAFDWLYLLLHHSIGGHDALQQPIQRAWHAGLMVTTLVSYLSHGQARPPGAPPSARVLALYDVFGLTMHAIATYPRAAWRCILWRSR